MNKKIEQSDLFIPTVSCNALAYVTKCVRYERTIPSAGAINGRAVGGAWRSAPNGGEAATRSRSAGTLAKRHGVCSAAIGTERQPGCARSREPPRQRRGCVHAIHGAAARDSAVASSGANEGGVAVARRSASARACAGSSSCACTSREQRRVRAAANPASSAGGAGG